MAKALLLLSVGTCFRIVFALQQPYGFYAQSPQQNPFSFRNYQDQSLNQHSVNSQHLLNDYQRQIQQLQAAVLGSQSGQAIQPTPSGPVGSIWLRDYYDSTRNQPETIPPTPTIVAPLPPNGPPETQEPGVYPPAPSLPESPITEIPGNELTQPEPVPIDNPLQQYCKAERGQFPSKSCSKFVNCWDGVVIEQDCPGGLYFNGDKGYCDYAVNVPCKDGGSGGVAGEVIQGPIGGVGGGVSGGGSEGVSGPGGAGGEGSSVGSGGTVGLGELGAKCPEAYGTYRSKKNCGVFYVCAASIPYEFVCPAGLNFHEDLKVCDYPYRVECNGVPTNVAPPVPTTEAEVATTGLPLSESGLPATAPVNPPVDNTIPSTQGQADGSSSQTAFYSLRKIPAGLLDSSKPCAYNTVFRLNPSCTSVAVCENGLTRIIKCGPGTSYDSYTHQCAPSFRALC